MLSTPHGQSNDSFVCLVTHSGIPQSAVLTFPFTSSCICAHVCVSFFALLSDRDLDIDDPDFWTKIGLQEKSKSEVLSQRSRHQVKRYGYAEAGSGDEGVCEASDSVNSLSHIHINCVFILRL